MSAPQPPPAGSGEAQAPAKKTRVKLNHVKDNEDPDGLPKLITWLKKNIDDFQESEIDGFSAWKIEKLVNGEIKSWYFKSPKGNKLYTKPQVLKNLRPLQQGPAAVAPAAVPPAAVPPSAVPPAPVATQPAAAAGATQPAAAAGIAPATAPPQKKQKTAAAAGGGPPPGPGGGKLRVQLATSYFLEPDEDAKGKDSEGEVVVCLQIDPPSPLPAGAKELTYLVSIKAVGAAAQILEPVMAARREHSQKGIKHVVCITGLEPATSYTFKVANVDGEDDLIGSWSSATGTILSSEGTPSEMLANTLKSLQVKIGEAVERFKVDSENLAKQEEGHLTLAEEVGNNSCEDLMEECRKRADAINARQEQLIESRNAGGAVEAVIEECNGAIKKIQKNRDQLYKVAALKAAQLPQDVLEAAGAYQKSMTNVNLQITNIECIPKMQEQMALFLQAKNEIEASGTKLANALEDAQKDACFQIDWSKNPADASEAIKTLKKAKQLAKNTETGSAKNTEMGSSIDRLITAFENLKQESVGIVYTNPSINRQDSSIRP